LTSNPLKEDTCVRGHTLSLLLAIQPGFRLAGLLPKWGTLPPGRCFRRPVATLLWCKPWQSKRLSSIHFVQSRNCDNLLSSLFIHHVALQMLDVETEVQPSGESTSSSAININIKINALDFYQYNLKVNS
jgi:hypothetical protein